MSGFRSQQRRPSWYEDDDICSVLGRGYTWFSIIRCIFRVCACCVDCTMMYDVTAGSNLSNALQNTTWLCILCWIVKIIVTCIDCCRCSDIQHISNWLSLITLWIGEIPKTALHMIMAFKQPHTFHQNHPIYSILISSFKLIERVFGYRKKYDWTDNRSQQEVTYFYIAGITLETIAALVSVVLAFT